MRIFTLSLSALLMAFATTSVMAQQGHPLAGIWIGDWGPATDTRNFVVVEMNWHDTTLSGNINPGFPDAATITGSELNSSNWTVHLEAQGNDESGNSVSTMIDGRLENLGSPNRVLSGTWQKGAVKGDFTLTRE
jgi:hypothetical protein